MILHRGSVTTPTKWDKSNIEKAYALCVLGATNKVLGVAFGVPETTISVWKQKYPEFAEAIEKGVQNISKDVAMNFVKAATGYYHDETTTLYDADGNMTGKRVVTKYERPDTWAGRVWLQLHNAEIWGNTDKIKEGNTIININNLDMKVLSTEELNLMKGIAMKNNLLPDVGD